MAALAFQGVSSAVANPATHTIELFMNGRQTGIIQCEDKRTYMGFIPAVETFRQHLAQLRAEGVTVQLLDPLTAAMAALRIGR